MTLIVSVAAFIVSATLTSWLSRPQAPFRILDYPNERSLHRVPLPRTGGLAIAIAVVGATALLALSRHVATGWLVAGAALVATVSFLDDCLTLSAGVRILTHLAAAWIFLRGGDSVTGLELPGLVWSWSPWIGTVASMLFLAWMVNVFNFMDGMDGFAAGMAVVGFGTLAFLGWASGNVAFFSLSSIVAAAAAGFLCFNLPPARIFMGDLGSSLLGFLAGAFCLWAAAAGIFALWVGVLVFSAFFVDATVTLIRRLARGEKVWRAHRSHYYQRLVQAGWGHRRTLRYEYVLMLVSSAAGMFVVLAVPASPAWQWSTLATMSAIYLASGVVVHRVESQGVSATDSLKGDRPRKPEQ